MSKIISATLAVAFIAATAGQALALNPQPLPPRKVHFVISHVFPRCPPPKGLGRTCV